MLYEAAERRRWQRDRDALRERVARLSAAIEGRPRSLTQDDLANVRSELRAVDAELTRVARTGEDVGRRIGQLQARVPENEKENRNLREALSALRAELQRTTEVSATTAAAVSDILPVITELRGELFWRLDRQVEEGVILRGRLQGEFLDDVQPLMTAYQKCLQTYGLRHFASISGTVRTTSSNGSATEAWYVDVYAGDDSSVDEIGMALLTDAKSLDTSTGQRQERREALHALLAEVGRADNAMMYVGDFAAVRTESELLFGVVKESIDDPATLAQTIRQLPPNERCELAEG